LLEQLAAKDRLLTCYRVGAMPSETTHRILEKTVYGKTPREWAEQRIAEERG
jgi:ribosomal protein S16